MTEKEKTLIAGCLRGEKAAWDSFVQQYSNLVYHTIKTTFGMYHHHSGTEEVEDLFQEFFVAMLRDDCKKLRQFRGERGCTLASWVRLVATRLTIDFIRSHVSNNITDVERIHGDQPDLSESLAGQEQEALLRRAFESLSARDQLFLNLFYRQCLTPADIAGILNMSVGAVYTHKSRLLDKLRDVLKKSGAL